MGRFLGRIHAVGAIENFPERPALNIATLWRRAAQLLARTSDFIPADLIDAYRSVVEQALDGVRHCYERAGK